MAKITMINKHQYELLLQEFDYLVESGNDDERLEEIREILKHQSTRGSKDK